MPEKVTRWGDWPEYIIGSDIAEKKSIIVASLPPIDVTLSVVSVKYEVFNG